MKIILLYQSNLLNLLDERYKNRASITSVRVINDKSVELPEKIAFLIYHASN